MYVARWVAEARRTAWIAAGVSLVVDAAAIIVSSRTTVYRCFDGYTNLSSTFRNIVLAVGIAACVTTAWVIRFDRRRPSSEGRPLVAYLAIAVSVLATLLASWLVLQGRPERPCLD